MNRINSTNDYELYCIEECYSYFLLVFLKINLSFNPFYRNSLWRRVRDWDIYASLGKLSDNRREGDWGNRMTFCLRIWNGAPDCLWWWLLGWWKRLHFVRQEWCGFFYLPAKKTLNNRCLLREKRDVLQLSPKQFQLAAGQFRPVAGWLKLSGN